MEYQWEKSKDKENKFWEQINRELNNFQAEI